MDSAKNDLADKLKNANNILVTVSRNPSVDQLAACLGLTLLLNKLGKHAAAIFSGQIPSTIQFLEPEETLERNTDSLRDFIIALDKSKADKLRYKVEDNVVRIFITPYRTSISEKDLDFSQGDFNVDVVVALGVREQEDLDLAITAHGRILHDAVVTSINLSAEGSLGSIAWHDPQASSLCELVTDLVPSIGEDLLDSQIATALLTGIVSATERFSNDRTTSQTMNVSARLMVAGANQQLVASKLATASPTHTAASPPATETTSSSTPVSSDNDVYKSPDGTLEIRHDENEKPSPPPARVEPEPEPAPAPMPEPELPSRDADTGLLGRAEHQNELELPAPQLKEEVPNFRPAPPPPLTHEHRTMLPIDEHHDEPADTQPAAPGVAGGLMTEAPTMGGVLTANTQPEGLDATTDPMSLAGREPDQLFGGHGSLSAVSPVPSLPSLPSQSPQSQAMSPATSLPPEPANFVPPTPSFNPAPPPPMEPVGMATPANPITGTNGDGQTLADIERSVASPHVNPPDLGGLRDEVNASMAGSGRPDALQSLGAQPLGSPLHQFDAAPATPQPAGVPAMDNPGNVVAPGLAPAPDPGTPAPGSPMSAPMIPASQMADMANPTAPPPVPPPIPFQFGN